jgi:heme exporter protein C
MTPTEQKLATGPLVAARATRPSPVFPALVGFTGLLVLTTLYWAFFRAPFEAVMGAAQKIFYFHVPAAYAMYLSAAVCFVGSAAYLYQPTDRRDALARGAAEVAVAFGLVVLTTGPIWARPIWGVYWTWEPRLLTSLLSVLIYVSYVVLRSFAGDGEAERKFAAALGVLGAANLPIIHYSVQKWGGNHPRVISSGGGGLGHPDMKTALLLGFAAFTSLAVVLIWSRLKLHDGRARLARLEEEAATLGLLDDEA